MTRRLVVGGARLATLAATLFVAGCIAEATPTSAPRGAVVPPSSSGASSQVRLAPAPDVAGNPEDGRRLFLATGCGGCHSLPGLPGATGVHGPILTNVVLRPTLAGETIPMTPENMTRWLLDPPALKPGTPMPNVGLTEQQARDITAFLYSQPRNPGRE